MAEPQQRIDGIRQQGCTIDDADETELLAVVTTDLAYAKLYAVTRAGAVRFIGRSTEGACGKIDSAWPRAFRDGTARLYLSAANVGGSGTTSHTVYFDFPDAVPPSVSASGGSAYVAAPNGGSIRIMAHDKTQPPWKGEQALALPASIPTNATLLNLRITAAAATAGARARVGPTNIMDGMLTAATQVVDKRVYADGMRPPGAGHTLVLMADNGELSECYVDVVGWELSE